MGYEIFLDSSYYDTWCVRPKGSRSFLDPKCLHFDSEEEARKYKEMVEQEDGEK